MIKPLVEVSFQAGYTRGFCKDSGHASLGIRVRDRIALEENIASKAEATLEKAKNAQKNEAYAPRYYKIFIDKKSTV